MKIGAVVAVVAMLAAAAIAGAGVVCLQQPGTGTVRSSQLWQDPGPNGNDLDGDAVIWSDFTLSAPAQINHLEWWGTGACELGFRVQIWKQDPGTIAYQPYGLFYYGGNHSYQPTRTFDVAPMSTGYTTGGGPNGTTHHVLELGTGAPGNPAVIALAANDASNVRWFIAIIGLTQQAYYTWNWSQGNGGSTQCYQFIRGGSSGSGPLFRPLGEGRALVIQSVDPVPTGACCTGTTCAVMLETACTGGGSVGVFQGAATTCGVAGNPTTCCPANFDGAGGLVVADVFAYLNAWFAGDPSTDFNASGALEVADIFAFLNAWFAGC